MKVFALCSAALTIAALFAGCASHIDSPYNGVHVELEAGGAATYPFIAYSPSMQFHWNAAEPDARDASSGTPAIRGCIIPRNASLTWLAGVVPEGADCSEDGGMAPRATQGESAAAFHCLGPARCSFRFTLAGSTLEGLARNESGV